MTQVQGVYGGSYLHRCTRMRSLLGPHRQQLTWFGERSVRNYVIINAHQGTLANASTRSTFNPHPNIMNFKYHIFESDTSITTGPKYNEYQKTLRKVLRFNYKCLTHAHN